MSNNDVIMGILIMYFPCIIDLVPCTNVVKNTQLIADSACLGKV